MTDKFLINEYNEKYFLPFNKLLLNNKINKKNFNKIYIALTLRGVKEDKMQDLLPLKKLFQNLTGIPFYALSESFIKTVYKHRQTKKVFKTETAISFTISVNRFLKNFTLSEINIFKIIQDFLINTKTKDAKYLEKFSLFKAFILVKVKFFKNGFCLFFKFLRSRKKLIKLFISKCFINLNKIYINNLFKNNEIFTN